MDWISEYQLFLFDFDGLLVDTEKLHFQAYIDLCARRGYDLKWTFHRYSEAAHHESTGLRDHIYAEFPGLHTEEPNWDVLYEEKKKIFLELLEKGKIPLMPGVNELLLALQEKNIPRCVVTHSLKSLIQKIRKQNPVLDTIPYWITRDDYTHAKPHPECYQAAIARYAKEDDKVIGFEDSPRGLQSLTGTRAQPILICPPDSPYIEKMLHVYPNVSYFPSFEAIQTRANLEKR